MVVTLDFPSSQKLIKTQVFIFFAWPIERFWKAANAWFSATPCSTLQSLLFFYSRGFFNPYTQALLGVPLAAAAQPAQPTAAATASAALNHHPLLGQLQVCLFPCSLTILPINVPFTLQGIRQGLNFPGLGPHHQGAVTVSASPTVASSATTVPVATPVVDTYLSQGIGPISHGVSDICPKNESHFHLFFAYRQPYPRANKGLLPTEEVALQHSKNGAFSRSELFMETHNTTRFFAEKARIHRVCISTTTTRVVS